MRDLLERPGIETLLAPSILVTTPCAKTLVIAKEATRIADVYCMMNRIALEGSSKDV